MVIKSGVEEIVWRLGCTAMDYYPPELVTPPLALVALLGCPELHSTVGEFLRSQHRPPINSIGLADPQSASRLFGEPATSKHVQFVWPIALEYRHVALQGSARAQ